MDPDRIIFPRKQGGLQKQTFLSRLCTKRKIILHGTTSESRIKHWLPFGITQHTGESHVASHQASRIPTTHAHR